MKTRMPKPSNLKVLTGSALVLTATASVLAQQLPFSAPGTAQPPVPPSAPTPVSAPAATAATVSTNGLDDVFGLKIPEAISKGKVNINARLRYEQVDQSSLPDQSFAPTIRTRVGYTTAPLYGFQAMVEGENVSVLGPEHNYNAAGSNGQGSRPVVADPPVTDLNQAWIAYTYTNLFTTKLGQQVINLDNQRFIGSVGWRQNDQTFTGVSAGSEPIEKLKLFYAYLWDVQRVFGNVDGLPPANQNFDSSSHLINISYSGWKYGRFVGYSYLLDLSNNAGNANSCATYGGYFAGQAPVTDKITADYRAEYAFQTDYAKSPQSYSASYYDFEGGLSIKPVSFGGGYEVLGSGANGGTGPARVGFRTPLATLHAFNGWDDVFLATPANGLQDIYGYFGIKLPYEIPMQFVFHKFNADHGSDDYGQEYDIVASRKFGKYWTALVKYACYNGQDAPAAYTVNKFWAQVEFNF